MGQLVRAVAASRKSSELFKTLRAVRVELNPFDHRSTTAREFLRRVRSPAVREANAKLKVDVHLIEEYGRATIGLEYADGRKQTLAAAGMKVREMLEEVERVARWSGDERNPFDAVREARARRLGL